MACYDTGSFVCTYDSGGAGSLPSGGDPDYSSLGTWESDSDNDLSGTGITALDCYDSQAHNDAIIIAGASNTDATHYREIRSASTCATSFAGKADTGANFERVGANENCFTIEESFFRIRDVVVNLTNNHNVNTSNYYAISTTTVATSSKVINCVVYDCINNGTGGATGGIIANGANRLVYNCIVYGNQMVGILLYNFFSGSTVPVAAICCTVIDNGNGTYGGIYSEELGVANERNWVWSCYAADNDPTDFRDDSTKYSGPSGWNSSKDSTSDLGSTAGDNYKNGNDLITGGELDSDYMPTGYIYWVSGAGNNAGRNPHNDLTAIYDFDNFFKNDTDGEDISKDDIRGVDRPTPDTADSSWCVGAAEYIVVSTEESAMITAAAQRKRHIETIERKRPKRLTGAVTIIAEGICLLNKASANARGVGLSGVTSFMTVPVKGDAETHGYKEEAVMSQLEVTITDRSDQLLDNLARVGTLGGETVIFQVHMENAAIPGKTYVLQDAACVRNFMLTSGQGKVIVKFIGSYWQEILPT